MHISLDQAIGRQPRLNRVGQSLLNIGSGASAAYSLRSLTGGEPKAVRIRRDGDNDERDFTTAEIVNEAAAWTNGSQETALPADLGVTSFTISALAYGLSSSGVSLAGGASLDDFDGTFTPNSDGTVWSNGSALGVNYTFDTNLNQWDLNFNDGTNFGNITISSTTKYPFQVTNWGSASVSTGVSGLASAWDQSFTDSYLDFAAVYGETTTYPTAEAAYSLRKVRSTYTGDVVKVRRESDNAEKGFTASEISSGALVDFVNADGTQFMNFDGTDDDITTPALLPATDDFTLTIVAFIESNPSSAMGIFGSAASGSGRHNMQINTDGTVKFFCEFLGGTITTTSAIIQKSINTIVLTRTGQTFEITVNGGGAASQTGSSVVLTTGNNNIGDPYVGGNFQGVITSLSVASTTWDGTIANVPAGSTVNGSPSTNALNDGFVTTWYDQSGNSNNATQTTAANQPLIVESGSLHTDGIKFDGSSDFLITSSSILSGEDFFVSSVQSLTSTSGVGNDAIWGQYTAGTSGRTLISADLSANDYEFFSQGANGIVLNSSTVSTDKKLLTVSSDGTTANLFRDGALADTDTSVGVSIQDIGFAIGAVSDGNLPYNGSIEEIIIYNSDQSSNRFKIESNINNHYTIYTAAQNGFVNKWYDQSGNSRNAVAAADANEPKIVQAGSYLGELSFDGSNHTLSVATVSTLGIDGTNNKSAFAVARTTAGTDGFVIAGTTGGANFEGLRYRSSASNGLARVEVSGFGVEGGDLSDGNNHVYSSIFDGTQTQDFDVSLDGSITQGSGTDAIDTDGTATFFISKTGGNAAAGFTREFILYASDQTANRTAIETNIANEYGITLS